MTPGQCKAARAFLGWPQKVLAHRAGVDLATLCRFEMGHNSRTIHLLQEALEAAGIVFVKRHGVHYYGGNPHHGQD